MAKSKNEYIKVRLSGNTLLAVVIYSAIMMGLGAMLKSYNDDLNAAREKIQKIESVKSQKTK